MKTAISLDEKLLKNADSAAGELGISRSRLFSIALEEYLQGRRHRDVVRKLNEVYSGDANAPDRRVLTGMKSKMRASLKDR